MISAPPIVRFDARLLQQYDRPLPRYTSYPTAAEFTPEFNQHHFKQAIATSNQRQSPLSLYVHIPFCQTACYFCGCNVIVTQSQTAAQSYLDCLVQDIQQTAASIDTSRLVAQMHWGGGTPNYLNLDQVEVLWRTLQYHFNFALNAEISNERHRRKRTVYHFAPLARFAARLRSTAPFGHCVLRTQQAAGNQTRRD